MKRGIIVNKALQIVAKSVNNYFKENPIKEEKCKEVKFAVSEYEGYISMDAFIYIDKNLYEFQDKYKNREYTCTLIAPQSLGTDIEAKTLSHLRDNIMEELSKVEEKKVTVAANESKGERLVREALNKMGVRYCPQYRFPDCKDKFILPFDFMCEINGQKCLIEFDGRQHFESVDFFGGDGQFEMIQRHDSIKNQYCKNHNIPLLRIKYTDIDNVEEILKQFFRYVQNNSNVKAG